MAFKASIVLSSNRPVLRRDGAKLDTCPRGGDMPGMLRLVFLPLTGAVLLSGCGTPNLDAGRASFYRGRLDEAVQVLSPSKIPDTDRVLYLMERGMARQLGGDYAESASDFIEAADVLMDHERISISRGGASYVINDSVQSFKGAPFERSLLHAFTAKNHLARGIWDNGAVEARRLLDVVEPEQRGDYPEDAYSRYMTGFCFEMIDDLSNAARQYEAADKLAPNVEIDVLGRLSAVPGAKRAAVQPRAELVCFVLAGRARSRGVGGHASAQPVYAEIRHAGSVLGRSHVLTDTVTMSHKSDEVEAGRESIKTLTRIAIKESIAQTLEAEQDGLGDVARIILFGLLEQPDNRRWETLPRWLSVARVPCPEDLGEFEVVFRRASGGIVKSIRMPRPQSRRRNTYIAFCRDIVPAD